MASKKAQGRQCPRECGRKLNAHGYNARSHKDNKQICPECYIEEAYRKLLEEK